MRKKVKLRTDPDCQDLAGFTGAKDCRRNI